MEWTVRDWFGTPRRPAYWWDDKREKPGPPPPDIDPKVAEEWMAAGAKVEGAIDVSDDAKPPK